MFFPECVLLLSFGRTQSLCHISPPSPSFPFGIYSSPPIRVLAVRGARREAWSWRCLGGVTHDDTINATASYRGIEHFEAELDLLSTFDLESTSFPSSSRRFSYLFLSADETQTSSSQQRRWVWMTSRLIRGSRWLQRNGNDINSLEREQALQNNSFFRSQKRGWSHQRTWFRTKVGAKRTNGTRMRHPNPRRRTPASRKLR